MGRTTRRAWARAAAFALATLAGCSPAPAFVSVPLEPQNAPVASASAPKDPPPGLPVAVEAAGSPWRIGDTWTGSYECTQGQTDLRLHVRGVQGGDLDVVFDFEHAATGAAGQFEMSGKYDPASRRLRLVAGEWITRPARYVTVDLEGRTSADGRTFAGRVPTAGCGAFSVHRSP